MPGVCHDLSYTFPRDSKPAMLILEAALLAILADTPPAVKPPEPPPAQSTFTALGGPELARSIRKDLESISGPGTVDVRIEHGTLFTVRIAMPSFNPEACASIRSRELELDGLFPNLSFDFRFAAPDLARAIKSDIESISGGGTVDVSVDRETLFNIRVTVPSLNSRLYSQIYDRALEFYRVFPDLSFDFYLWQKL